jgi:hypothetical protein
VYAYAKLSHVIRFILALHFYHFYTPSRHLFIPRSHARHDFIVHEFYVLSPLKMLTIITIGSKHTQEIVFNDEFYVRTVLILSSYAEGSGLPAFSCCLFRSLGYVAQHSLPSEIFNLLMNWYDQIIFLKEADINIQIHGRVKMNQYDLP